MDTSTLVDKAKEFISKNIPQGIEFVSRKNLTELLVGFFNQCQSDKPKFGTIKVNWFKSMKIMNEWYGSGENCEIISISFDAQEVIYFVFYRLKQ